VTVSRLTEEGEWKEEGADEPKGVEGIEGRPRDAIGLLRATKAAMEKVGGKS